MAEAIIGEMMRFTIDYESTRGIDCCQKPLCPDPCDRSKRPSIRHCMDICSEDGGFSVVIRCANPTYISVDVYRAGCTHASDLDFNLKHVKNKGDTYYFAFPKSFWEYPVGYYNADIYYGEQYVTTIRLNLHPTLSVTRAEARLSESDCSDRPAPNTEKVSSCCPVCECDKCECCDNNEYPSPQGMCGCGKQLHPLDDLKEFINEARVCTRCEMTEWLNALGQKVDGVELPEACFETDSIQNILANIDNLDDELNQLLKENDDQ